MNIAIWLPIAVAVLASSTPITGGRRGHLDQKQLAKFEALHGLPLPPALLPPVVAAIRRRERAMLWCGGVGLVVTAALALVAQLLHAGDFGPLLPIGVTFSATLGGFVAVLRDRDRLVAQAPRIARATETALSDYVPKGARMGFALAPVAMVISLASSLAALLLLDPRPGPQAYTPIILTVATIVTLVLWGLLVLARRVVLARPQYAHTDLELAWDDALRAHALRDLGANGVALGVLAAMLNLVFAGAVLIRTQVRVGQMELTAGLGVGVLVVTLACAALTLVPHLTSVGRTRHFLGLWRGHDFARAA